jgi:hypothetical protein
VGEGAGGNDDLLGECLSLKQVPVQGNNMSRQELYGQCSHHLREI